MIGVNVELLIVFEYNKDGVQGVANIPVTIEDGFNYKTLLNIIEDIKKQGGYTQILVLNIINLTTLGKL